MSSMTRFLCDDKGRGGHDAPHRREVREGMNRLRLLRGEKPITEDEFEARYGVLEWAYEPGEPK